MAASGQKLICLDGMGLDVAPQYLKATQARYVKNLYYQLSDLGDAGTVNGANTGVAKPLPSNEIYAPMALPEGDSHVIGTLPSRETNELYVWVYNSLGNHFIFRVNSLSQTIDVSAPNPCFNFKLSPEYFIGEGQCYLEVIYITDPVTNLKTVKKDLYWTDGFNYQGYLRFEDYLNTNGFDPETFSYFQGGYDKCTMLRMGLPTPSDCIKIDEVAFVPTDIGKNDNIKYSPWQFRVLDIDVFSRPSGHGIISDLVYLSNNDCLGASDMLSRCWNLTFEAGNPLIDKKQIEFRNCNDEQWYIDSVLELYQGSNLGEWWKRDRNPDINYDPSTNKITYKFCKDKLCDPIDPNETNTENGLPRSSQSVTKIGKNIALSNNKDRFPPFSKKNVLDKISIIVDKPVPSKVGDTANIEIWIRIYNPNVGKYQKIWKNGADYVFGGIANGTGISNIKSDYQQYFAVSGQKGYLGYLAGTNNYAIGVQYYLDGNNELVKDEDFTQDYDKPYFIKFEFSGVPKSVYLFRLASHLADPNIIDIKTTSTYVGGVYNFSNLTVGSQKNYYKEIVIDVCTNDYDTLTSGEMLLAFDLTDPKFYGNRINPFLSKGHFSDSSVGDGYVYEDIDPVTIKKENPVSSLQLLTDSSGIRTINSVITDHNGFYFTSTIRPDTLSAGGNVRFILRAIGYCNCIKKELVRVSIGKNFRRYNTDMVIGAPGSAPVTTSCLDFETLKCSRVLIKGRLKLCNSETGVPNINVVISGGGVGTSDSNGDFTIVAYDDIINGHNNNKLYILGGGCSFTACDGGCIGTTDVSFSPCGTCNERVVATGEYSILFVSNRGLLSNGRYGISLTGYDWLGRHGFAQTTDKLYFNTPSLNEIKTFGFSKVSVAIPPDIIFDDWVDYLTVGITVELNYGGNLIEWIADKVTFVDNSGIENLSAPTQIRIDYSSLNEFNSKNNFNTTTGWQIIPSSTTSPRTADIVQFIRNGNGDWFDSPITALVKYDSQGQYFLINYTDALKDLKANSLIRLANPVDCTNKDQFFEICGKIKVINGIAQTNTVLLNAFDTYFQYRQIPVPVVTGIAPDTTTVIELRQFGFPFEHPSVSDFYGYKCANYGRFNVKNPYENELLHINQIALSGVLSVNAQLNYLNYFDENQKYDIIIADSGGIVYVRAKTGIVLVVCQYTDFLIGFNDNSMRVDNQGNVIVPSAADKFGNPLRDTVAQYGCQLFDKNTIREKEGLVEWLDRSRIAILQHNYSQCSDVARYNKSDSTIVTWLTKKIKYQNALNKINSNKRYFHAVVNPLNFEWILSEFTIGSNEFVNEERQENVSLHETISFDTIVKVWKSFLSPTPEMFGYLENTRFGQILFSFRQGMAYSHSGTSFNVFFGIKCESVYRFIFNTDSFKKKKFQAVSVYCEDKKYWSDLILTEKQQSRLLKNQWKKAEYFYSAPFLCDIDTKTNGVNKLFDWDNLFGSWIDVRLIGDADEKYSELYGVIVFAQGEEQTGS